MLQPIWIGLRIKESMVVLPRVWQSRILLRPICGRLSAPVLLVTMLLAQLLFSWLRLPWRMLSIVVPTNLTDLTLHCGMVMRLGLRRLFGRWLWIWVRVTIAHGLLTSIPSLVSLLLLPMVVAAGVHSTIHGSSISSLKRAISVVTILSVPHLLLSCLRNIAVHRPMATIRSYSVPSVLTALMVKFRII